MTRNDADSVSYHLVDHAARQRAHENHGPGANRDGAQHYDGTPVITPQVTPGQAAEYDEHAHQCVLIASTGCSLCRRSAGYAAAASVNRNTTNGPANIVSSVARG